jgi:hypothetical protein
MRIAPNTGDFLVKKRGNGEITNLLVLRLPVLKFFQKSELSLDTARWRWSSKNELVERVLALRGKCHF